MKALILGGGISGLSAAWRLSKLHPDIEITLLEKSPRLGGWIETGQSGDFLFERGPRTFSAARSPILLNLIAEVGLEKDLLFSKKSAKTRYLWHRGRLKSASSLFLPHAWRLLLEPFVPKGSGEETIHTFASRRFGSKIAELFFDPITLGVFAGDSRTLSMEACFPKLVEMEQRYGSLLLSVLQRKKKQQFPGTLFTLQGGMQRLIDVLGASLSANLILGAEVLAVAKENKGWRVETGKGSIYADVVFPALPAHALRTLLPTMPPIESVSLTLVNLGFADLAMPKKGYGYLVPSSEEEALLGMIFDSEIFGGSSCRLTAMVRGSAPDPKRVVLDALMRHLRVSSVPDQMEIHRRDLAIPQLGVGQKKEILSWAASLDRFYLLGNYIDGPAVEQCVERSEKMTNLFFEKMFRD